MSSEFGAPFERGPDELKDLPAHFGKSGRPPDLSRYAVRIFAEIVEATRITTEAIVARAGALRAAGADVIDLGCLPDTPFPHLEDAVRALKERGFSVSVDSADLEELRRAGLTGADYLLSLTEHSLSVAEETGARPILVRGQPRRPRLRSAGRRRKRNAEAYRPFSIRSSTPSISASPTRWRDIANCSARLPRAEMMMGTGNLTELTDADSVGVTALLLGICSELDIANVLTVQVSPHTRRTIQEHDAARRIMYAAATDEACRRATGARCSKSMTARRFQTQARKLPNSRKR